MIFNSVNIDKFIILFLFIKQLYFDILNEVSSSVYIIKRVMKIYNQNGYH